MYIFIYTDIYQSTLKQYNSQDDSSYHIWHLKAFRIDLFAGIVFVKKVAFVLIYFAQDLSGWNINELNKITGKYKEKKNEKWKKKNNKWI